MTQQSKLKGIGYESNSSLEKYLNKVSKYLILTDDETDTKIDEINSRIDAIIKGNLKLIVSVAINIYQSWIEKGRVFDLMDLIQVGNETALDCIHTYDADKDAKFSTYLVTSVRNNIMRYIRENTGALNLSKSEAHRTIHYNLSVIKDLYKDPDVTTEEIAATYNVSERDIELILNKDNFKQYLEDPITDVYDQMLRLDNIGMVPYNDDGEYNDPFEVPFDNDDVTLVNPESSAIHNEELLNLRIKIDEFRDTLSPKHLVVFDSFIYGDCTRQEVADSLGISPNSVTKMKSRILVNARTFFTLEDLKALEETN